MPAPIVRAGSVWQGSDVKFLERVVNDSGDALTSADVTKWSLRVFERNDDRDGKKLVTDASPTGYVEDSLLTTEGWTKDTVGWNFKYRLSYDDFKAIGGRTYRFEFRFVTASYGDIYVVYRINYIPMGSR